MTDHDRSRSRRIGITWFTVGLVICLGAALLLLLDVIESGWAAAIGMIGIGLIATSRSAARSGSDRR